MHLEAIDREAYLRALVAIAHADDELHETELAFLRHQAEVLDVDLDAILESPRVALERLRERTDAITRRMVIRDCITLAAIDGELDATERARIREVAEQLGVSAARVDALESWLARYSALLEEGETLLESAED